MEHLWGQLYATPAVAEKGMLDAEIRVETLGGHSSVPRKPLDSTWSRAHDLMSIQPCTPVSATWPRSSAPWKTILTVQA